MERVIRSVSAGFGRGCRRKAEVAADTLGERSRSWLGGRIALNSLSLFSDFLDGQLDGAASRSTVAAQEQAQKGSSQGDGAGNETGKQIRVFGKELAAAKEERVVLDGVLA